MQLGKNIFDSQLQSAIDEYPNLTIKGEEDNRYLSGSINICDEGGMVIQSFFIEIRYSDGFPSKFPILYEVGGYIPRDIDWHKYQDDSCCVAVAPIETICCRNGITINAFIKKHVIPYLANQFYRKNFGKYKDEYAHGIKGLIESYQDIMRTSDMKLWSEYLSYIIEGTKPAIGRNSLCTCGSGKKYKHCHLKVLEDLKIIGKKDIIAHFQQISNYLNKVKAK
jgi:hypothetical protein